MPQTSLPSAAYADSKPHYDILDGLRGVAALLVVVFHLCEAHATSHFDQLLNHGYLAVDFFFALSGFVIGYAYDDRWGRSVRRCSIFRIAICGRCMPCRCGRCSR